MDDAFRQEDATFLYWEIGVVPFKFLRIKVGVNHRRQKAWKEVIRNMKSKLSVWKGNFLSIGGSVTLINSVLNLIPIYYLSFYRMMDIVLKKLVRIQRKFLWSGGLDKKGSRGLIGVKFVSLRRMEVYVLSS